MVKGFIQGFLGIDQLKTQVDGIAEQAKATDQRVEAIDQRVTAVEGQVDMVLHHFGNYKNRTKEELDLMDAQIGDLLGSVQNLVARVKFGAGAAQAKALKKKVKLNQALIRKAKKAR